MSNRVNIDELIEKNKKEIEEVKKKCEELWKDEELPWNIRNGKTKEDSTEWDDLWVLRYVLSYKEAKGKEIYDAIKKSIEWRRENWTDLCKVRRGEIVGEIGELFKEKFPVDFLEGVCHAGGGPVLVSRQGLIDHDFYDKIDFDELIRFGLLERERIYYKCDQETRKTRTLIKVLAISDMTGTSFKNMAKFRKMMPKMKELSNLAEMLFPQFLEMSAMVNVPWWFGVVMKLMKKVMPAKIANKIIVCPTRRTETMTNGEIKTCPFVSKWFEDNGVLPDFLGGRSPCPQVLKGVKAIGTNEDENVTQEEVAKMEKEFSDSLTLEPPKD